MRQEVEITRWRSRDFELGSRDREIIFLNVVCPKSVTVLTLSETNKSTELNFKACSANEFYKRT